MQKDRQEKLIEIVMGEAITALLDSHDAISGATLANRLKVMLGNEATDERREAIEMALTEVRNEFASARDPIDATLLAFGQSLPDNNRKH